MAESYKRQPLGYDLPYISTVERYLSSLNGVSNKPQVRIQSIKMFYTGIVNSIHFAIIRGNDPMQ